MDIAKDIAQYQKSAILDHFGLAIPLMTAVFLAIVGYPLHCLLKRNPKTAKHESWIIWAVALFICLVVLDLATKYGW